jgi:hypothetical protein
MGLNIEQRESDSPFVEWIWRSRSEHISAFTSIAVCQWDLVIWKQEGKTSITVQGPETKARPAPVPEDAEFFGILFKTGTFMPHLPASTLVDGNAMLPEASSRSFWLHSEAWEVPTYENAETFVERLVRDGLLVHEAVVAEVLAGHQPNYSLRSIQRRFLAATGLTHGAVLQIERARHAALLLQQGTSILDTVYEAGYFDQPHLTKSLKHFIGLTPMQLMDKNATEQLSFLYNTSSFCPPMMDESIAK